MNKITTYKEFLELNEKMKIKVPKKKKNLAKMNRVIDIQDPDTGYNMVRDAYERGYGMKNGSVCTNPKELDQPHVD